MHAIAHRYYKRFIPATLCALILIGCKTSPKPAVKPATPPPPTPIATTKAKPRFSPLVTVQPKTEIILPIVYPPNWRDYKWWDIMHSTNAGASWEIWSGPHTNSDGSIGKVMMYNLEMPESGPTNDIEVARSLPMELFRMRGHTNRIGPIFPPQEPDPYVEPWDPIKDPAVGSQP